MLQAEKRYLITGGTGFLGERLVARLYSVCRLVVMSRNEGKLIALKEKYPNIEILTGDVSNEFEVHNAMQGVSGVFHLAAFKHVGMAEAQAYECINSNLVGSANVLKHSTKCDFVLGVSTDKAAQVSGVYGATKLLMERLFKQYEQFYPDVKYRIVRYGNVLGSTGSVVTKWIPLLAQGKEVIITDPEATRFYWTVDQAVDLIFDCLAHASDSTPFCPDMKALKVGDLLTACHMKYGVGELKTKVIGLQKGENKHEKVLDSGKYSNEVELFTLDEIVGMV